MEGSLSHQSNSMVVDLGLAPPPPSSIGRFLILPKVRVSPKNILSIDGEPLIDYSKSIIMTSKNYIAALVFG
jgi:hypothetical protein